MCPHARSAPLRLLHPQILSGGELFDRIVARGHYSEADARDLTITMVKAIQYLHSIGIAHRDLKPENLLLKDDSENAVVKITDFGLSKIFAPDAEAEVVMKTACGTPGYVAPEVLQHDPYTSQVDLWSIGVIVYILLCGFPPFYGDNDAQMFRKIKAAQYKFLAPYWDPISDEAKDFVAKLLVVDPAKRMTPDQCLEHAWLKSKDKTSKNLFAGKDASGSAPEPSGDGEAMDNMHASFVDFNLDRKMGEGMAKLTEAFDLPAGSAKLKKSKCALVNTVGQLYVTTFDVCFIGIGGKKLRMPLGDITEVKKAKRFAISPGDGHAIHITTKDGTKHEFNGFTEREATYVEMQKAASAQSLSITFK